MKMVLVVISVLFLVFGAMGCGKTQQPQPYTPDTHVYTADQVILIVQEQYPTTYRRVGLGTEIEDMETPPSITVAYVGGSRGVWGVQLSAPAGCSLEKPFSYVHVKTMYFHETDGTLRDTP